jgi:hypothetical protein
VGESNSRSSIIPTFNSPGFFDPKTLDPNSEVIRFLTLFHMGGIKDDAIRMLLNSTSYIASEAFKQ